MGDTKLNKLPYPVLFPTAVNNPETVYQESPFRHLKREVYSNKSQYNSSNRNLPSPSLVKNKNNNNYIKKEYEFTTRTPIILARSQEEEDRKKVHHETSSLFKVNGAKFVSYFKSMPISGLACRKEQQPIVKNQFCNENGIKKSEINSDPILQKPGDQLMEAKEVRLEPLSHNRGRKQRVSLTSSQNHLSKRRCFCGNCQECTKDFPLFLKMYLDDNSVPVVSAKSWGVWKRNQKGRFVYLYGKRPYKTRQIASLTKMLVALVTVEKFAQWGFDIRRVSYRIPSYCADVKGTVANLQPNQIISVQDLIHGLMLPSGNDASLVLGEIMGLLLHLSYRKKLHKFDVYNHNSFVSFQGKTYSQLFLWTLNERIREIGLTGTRLFNVHGNDAFDTTGMNVSNIIQLGRICEELLSNQYMARVIATKQHKNRWTNTNKLLWEGFSGLKTGVNQCAGPCLAALYQDCLVVLLNSKTMEDRWSQTKKLVRWARNHTIHTPQAAI